MIYKLSLSAILIKLLLIGIAFNCLFYFAAKNFDFVIYVFSFIIIVGLEVLIFFLKPFLYKIVVLENSICFCYKKFLINSFSEKVKKEQHCQCLVKTHIFAVGKDIFYILWYHGCTLFIND